MPNGLSQSAPHTASALLSGAPASLPAFHYAIRNRIAPSLHSAEALETVRGVVQAYRIPHTLTPEDEAEQAAHVVRHVLDRLARLRGAYGEWRTFDAPAYFDLTHAQSALLLELGERVTLVHAFFHADLLLPSMQALLAYWQQMEPPPALSANLATEIHERHAQQVRPELERRWQRAVSIVSEARRILAADVQWLAANAADEERWRWRPQNDRSLYLLGDLPIAQIPTLALTMDFPLPAWRQPGRVRRLRKNRAHNARRSRHG